MVSGLTHVPRSCQQIRSTITNSDAALTRVEKQLRTAEIAVVRSRMYPTGIDTSSSLVDCGASTCLVVIPLVVDGCTGAFFVVGCIYLGRSD